MSVSFYMSDRLVIYNNITTTININKTFEKKKKKKKGG